MFKRFAMFCLLAGFVFCGTIGCMGPGEPTIDPAKKDLKVGNPDGVVPEGGKDGAVDHQ